MFSAKTILFSVYQVIEPKDLSYLLAIVAKVVTSQALVNPKEHMSDSIQKSRRNFIKKAVGSAIITGVPSGIIAQPSHYIETLAAPRNFTANDKVNIAVIGMGIMGFNNAETSTQVPGVKLVAACDL